MGSALEGWFIHQILRSKGYKRTRNGFRGTGQMKPFERKAVRLMVGGHIQTDVLTRVYEAVEASFDHTGAGYFLSVHDDGLPVESSVFHSPIVLGRAGDIEVGFIVFVGERELTLECHGWGDGLPEDVRERDFVVSVQPKPKDME